MFRTSFLLVSVAAVLLGGSPQAQQCQIGEVLVKNDDLPDIPGGVLGVSIVPGLCEGEAAASVFSTNGLTTIHSVSAGFGHSSGGNGFNATANIEIYDGVTFNGAVATLGPKVFDLNNDAQASAQLISTGINTFDLQNYNVQVSGSQGNYVVAWRININPNGTCLGGYSANLFTDNSGIGFQCTTTLGKNLIDIEGQGWRDAALANVGGFPLCPLFFNGEWVIRACVSQPTNPLQVQALNNPVPLGGLAFLNFVAPGSEGDLYVALASLGTVPGLPFPPHGTIPLNFDFMMQLSLTVPSIFIGFQGVVPPSGIANGTVLIPNDPAFAGFNFHVGFVTVPAAGLWGISDTDQVSVQ